MVTHLGLPSVAHGTAATPMSVGQALASPSQELDSEATCTLNVHVIVTPPHF